MTLGTQTSFVERLSRTSGANTISTASDATKQYLNEGCREFAKRVHGIATNGFITLNPTFDIKSNFAIRWSVAGTSATLGAVDIPVASADLSDATPTTVAGNIASNFTAYVPLTIASGGALGSWSVCCGWSASTWTFWLSPSCNGTTSAIVAATPTAVGYVDATPDIFGGTVTRASTTLTGGFPQNCNLEQSLPTGFLEMGYVQYGTQEVREAPFNLFLYPYSTGDPVYYSVRNKKIRIDPVPITSKRFSIYYTAFPADLGVDGASDAVSCPLPEEVHMAPVYWAAACLLEEQHELDKSIFYQRKFMDMVNDYKIREANNTPTIYPQRYAAIPPKVV
jgi:hypothetical protein